MPYETCSSFTVRSYEVDSYRHLNNGVYVSWFEQARLEFLQSLGFSYDGFADREQWFVVARTEVDFRQPLTSGDEARVRSSIAALGRSSVRWRQVLERTGGELVAEAVTVMVFHGSDGRSTPIPDDFRSAVERG